MPSGANSGHDTPTCDKSYCVASSAVSALIVVPEILMPAPAVYVVPLFNFVHAEPV